MKKKLIEVALPLEKINAESAREKSIRYGHPSTLHLWWARRPLAAARAVIWASLVDDPSSHPEEFPTEEDQAKERRRLFKILEELISWENSNNKEILDFAKKEITKSMGGNLPVLLDPFAGGGAIPLEAQRLGLESHAHDLNPVAVLINKAMIEIPPKFMNMSAINPDDRTSRTNDSWSGTEALSADVKYYGEWMKREAYKRIGHLYPKVKIPKEQGDGEATVIAWIWARTVLCPNPACGCRMPLASSYVLSKKKGKEAWVEPIVDDKKIVRFEVKTGSMPNGKETDKVGRAAVFRCVVCGEITTDQYVKQKGKEGGLGSQLMAIVAEGHNGRLYLSPNEEHIRAADVPMPESYPDGELPTNPRWFTPPAFGMTRYSQLFTHRQMMALTVFSELIIEARKKAEQDAIDAGWKDDHCHLANGGTGALSYSEAISVYLGFGVSRMADIDNAFCGWEVTKTQVRHLFTRHAIPMLWDYGENNVFNSAAGDFMTSLNSIIRVIDRFGVADVAGYAEQKNATSEYHYSNIMISTDPPYYDNIGYADLSDFFYLWMRNSLKEVYPDLFRTMMVPKAEELIATPCRHDGSMEKAKHFFEDGLYKACCQMYKTADEEIPLTIYYGYKQKDKEESGRESSSGWETMLSAIISAGFTITGTWPIRTELANRQIASGTNALASSIVLVCRKRKDNATQTTRRNLVNSLRRELRPALQKLQESNIAPVDLAQSAIGPGMAIYSKYLRVLEADGTPMTVRSALQVINEEIDLFFNEQVGELDTVSRFCVDLYTQCAYNDIKFGEAEVLANAKGASIPRMSSQGILHAKAGIVHLIERDKLPEKIDSNEINTWMLTQQLTRAMDKGGVEACANIVFSMFGSNSERAKDLAYRLYTIAEQKKWTNEAYAYNSLVVAWPDIQSRAAALKSVEPKQMSLFDIE